MNYIFQTNNYVFFVMDFYIGGDLFNFISTHKHVEEEQIKVIIIEVILGLDYLHEKGIIYRDLKVRSRLISRKT